MSEVTLNELENMVREVDAERRYRQLRDGAWGRKRTSYMEKTAYLDSLVLDAYRRWTETQPNLPKTVEGMEQLYTAFKQGWMEEKQRDEIRRLNHEYFNSLPVMTTPPDVWLTRALEFDRAFRGTDQDGDS